MCNQLAWSCYSYEIALAPRLGLRLRARAGLAGVLSPQLKLRAGHGPRQHMIRVLLMSVSVSGLLELTHTHE